MILITGADGNVSVFLDFAQDDGSFGWACCRLIIRN
jgi:hypothetical protein